MNLLQRLKFYKDDTLSGIIVAVALIPEAVAFALVGHFNPLVGLYAAFIMGLVTSLLGGRPGMISGATGSMVVVMVSLSISHGLQYVLAAVMLAGAFQILIGILKLGKFIRLVPQSAIFGFVNGLAIVIAYSQVKFLEGADYILYVIVALTMAIMFITPKLTKAFPAGLAAILIISLGVYFLHIDTKSVQDLGNIQGGLPSFSLPLVPLNFETLKIILPYSIILALVGLIESLLTLSVIDEMLKARGNANKECIAQGIGNSICSVFGAMGGCAMIGQSMINVSSGGKSRISSFVAAILLITFIVYLSPIIGEIPIGVLVGIMFVVAIKTFAWTSIPQLKTMNKVDGFVVIAVSIITIFADLAVAVILGVIISSLAFAYKQAKIRTTTSLQEDVKVYKLEGPLFFGSSAAFLELFDVENDPKKTIIDFTNTRVMDSSGIEAIDKLSKKYIELGKAIKLRHLSQDCKKALSNAQKYCTYELDDPSYKVARDL